MCMSLTINRLANDTERINLVKCELDQDSNFIQISDFSCFHFFWEWFPVTLMLSLLSTNEALMTVYEILMAKARIM